MAGTMNALAALFVQEREPDGDHERDILTGEAYSFKAFAVEGSTVALITEKGRFFLETKTVEGCKIVWFDYYPAHRADRVRWWFNASSVKDLGEKLRNSPDKRLPMEVLMTHWAAR